MWIQSLALLERNLLLSTNSKKYIYVIDHNDIKFNGYRKAEIPQILTFQIFIELTLEKLSYPTFHFGKSTKNWIE